MRGIAGPSRGVPKLQGIYRKIDRKIGRALGQYRMLRPGERLLVGLSGGKDSTTLLYSLAERQRRSALNYSLLPVFVDPGFANGIADGLRARCRALGLELHVAETDFGLQAHSPANRENPCFLCARLRRQRLFEMAEAGGCRTIALGHTRDDLIETFLLNICFAGEVSTMLPVQPFFDGRFRVIRPLAHVDEALIRQFMRAMGWEALRNPCPSANRTKREEIKELIAQLDRRNPKVRGNIFRAMHHVRPDYLPPGDALGRLRRSAGRRGLNPRAESAMSRASRAGRTATPDLHPPQRKCDDIMRDVQNERDHRNIPIDKVGIKNLRYPIKVLDRTNGYQHTVATINMYVDLPHKNKGTHMSRFVEIINQFRLELSLKKISEILTEMKASLNAASAHIEITFPYFIEKHAPVSAASGLMDYVCTIRGSSTPGGEIDIVSEVRVPISSVCPCSKEISEVGAHNQRGEVSLKVRFRKFIWIEDMIAVVEEAASSEVFSVLKRVDEKAVTERAYMNPKFVEDIVRDVATTLQQDDNITWFSVGAENFESIHNHSAYAHIASNNLHD